MKTLIAIASCAVLLPLSSFAAADGGKAAPAPQRPAASAPAAAASASPAASAARRAVTSGRHQHQLLAQCNQKVNATGATGAARKRAMADCLKAS